METKRSSAIAGTVFNSVFDYAVPVDLKGNKVIDIYPQVNRYPQDVWLQNYNQYFDTQKGQPWSTDMFTINFNTGLKSIRINAPFLQPPIILDPCNSLTGAGTYTAEGGATDPTIDNVNYVANGGALQFDLEDGQAQGNIRDILVSPIDLSAHLNQSTLFLWTYFATPDDIVRVVFQWGSDLAGFNFYQGQAETTYQGTDFQVGWNQLAFPWASATVTGTPDPSSIQNLNVLYDYNGTLQTAVRLDNINSNLGSILNIEYYSKYLFRNASTGAFQENATATSDLINLDTESYNILLYQCGYLAAQQQQGIDALFYDSNFFLQKYNDAVTQYKAMYKSEVQLPQSSYYPVRKGGYGLWGGGPYF